MEIISLVVPSRHCYPCQAARPVGGGVNDLLGHTVFFEKNIFFGAA